MSDGWIPNIRYFRIFLSSFQIAITQICPWVAWLPCSLVPTVKSGCWMGFKIQTTWHPDGFLQFKYQASLVIKNAYCTSIRSILANRAIIDVSNKFQRSGVLTRFIGEENTESQWPKLSRSRIVKLMDRGWVTRPRVEYWVEYRILGEFYLANFARLSWACGRVFHHVLELW